MMLCTSSSGSSASCAACTRKFNALGSICRPHVRNCFCSHARVARTSSAVGSMPAPCSPRSAPLLKITHPESVSKENEWPGLRRGLEPSCAFVSGGMLAGEGCHEFETPP